MVQKANRWEIEKYINLAQDFDVFPGFFFLFNPRNFSILQCDIQERICLLNWYFELMETYDNPKMLVAIKPLLRSLSEKKRKEFRLYYPTLKHYEKKEPAHWLNV